MAAERSTLTMTAWRRLRQLSWSDRWLLAQALVLLPLAWVAVRCVGFRRLRAALLRFTPRQPAGSCLAAEHEVKTARHYAGIVGIAARRGLVRGNCLQRTLTLWWLLARTSISSEVHVGVRSVAGRLEAHAWLEVGGQIIADHADIRRHYIPFDRALLSSSSTSC
ncbi:MAG: lasso peptide biosynthesis B2 protein [Planctomycetes bacterium]|nr:lasso peptide biosynthesis B2 protein [Planctomycetota bacterium]